LTKKGTISSGYVAGTTVSWNVLVGAASTTCLFGMLLVTPDCRAQTATVEHSKVEPATKNGKPVVAQSQSAKSKTFETSATGGKKADGGKTSVVDNNAKDKHSSVPAAHNKVRPAAMLVPPPPPDTPTMLPNFGGGDESNGLMPMEYMSPDLLKKRKEDLVLQLADAKSEAKKRVEEAQSIKEKGVQFKTLFEEGVISKRELDAAEKDANDVDSSIARAKLRVSELQTLLDGVSGRINQINKKSSSKSIAIKVISTKQKKKHGG
jgi:hypothetical protein